MDAFYSTLICVITVGSILLNVLLANQRDYYKTSVKVEECNCQFWKGTALLYQKQLHASEDRHMKTIHELSSP